MSSRSGAQATAPTVIVDAALVSRNREEACTRIDTHKIHDSSSGAEAAGMLKPDFEAVRNASRNLQIISTFRDSNRACLPHLAAGVQSKPHSILQKTWDSGNLLPQDAHLAGLVSNLMKKPPKEEKVINPEIILHNGAPVTCDYDLMDLAEKTGERIPGESPRELEIRGTLNRVLPKTPQGQRDRIMHGSQAGYSEYSQLHSDEPVVTGLFKPEAPLTAFGFSGAAFRLESLESVLDFYRCYQIPLSPRWSVEEEDRSITPPRRTRLQ